MSYSHTTSQLLPLDNINRRAGTLVTEVPAVTTIGRTSPCPCQTYFECLPNTPLATEELEKEFWSRLHLMQPHRDAEKEMRLQKLWRQRDRDRAREAAAQKGIDKGEGSARKKIIDSSDSYDSNDKRDRETRQQRAGDGTAAESIEERAKSDRERRENKYEPRMLTRSRNVFHCHIVHSEVHKIRPVLQSTNEGRGPRARSSRARFVAMMSGANSQNSVT